MAQTPFWLEIKTEHIDANLDKVIEYLSKEASNNETDSFYEETEKLLGKRVRELVGTLAAQPLSAEECSLRASSRSITTGLVMIIQTTGCWCTLTQIINRIITS